MIGADGSGIGLAGPDHFLLRRADGHQDDVVLILAGGRLAFRHQRSDHGKRHVLDANHLAHRIFAGEQIVDNRLAQQRDFGGGFHVGVGERLALLDAQVADRQVVGRGADDLRAPVVVAIDHLCAAAAVRRGELRRLGIRGRWPGRRLR